MRPRSHWLKRPELWIMLFLLAFTLVNRWPLLSKLGTHTYYTAFDYCIYNWELLWNCHTLETMNFAGYWASNGMYPYPYAFAFSENMIGLTPFTLPIWLISRNPIMTINLLQLLLMWLTAVATFYAIRKMVGGGLPALAGTMIFSFYPYLSWSFTIGHPHILAMMWIPLIMFANWRFWQEGKLRHLALMFFLWYWTFLISVYLGIFLTVFIVLWNFIWFWHERGLFALKKIVRWCAAVFLSWALMIPVFLVYMQVTRDMGVLRTLEQQERFTGNVWSWLAVPPDNWLWAQQLRVLPPSGLMSFEDAMFPGLIALLMFIASFFVKGMPGWLKSLRWTALILAIFAIGPYALGVPWKVPLPFILLYYAFPPLWATRNPHRWGLFTVLAIGFLSAFMLSRLPKKRKTVILNLLLIAGISVEAWTYIHPKEALHPGKTQVYQSLDEKDGQRHVIAELPMGSRWGQWGWETKTLLTSTYHWQTVINGVTGLWPAVQFQLGHELKEFPSAHAIALLQALDVDRVLLNETKLRRRLPEMLPRMENSGELRFLRRIDRHSVWELARGASRRTLDPEADLAIIAPSQLPVGQATVGIEVEGARAGVVFNPKAPAHWKFPMARPWRIRHIDPDTGHADWATDWFAPGLFHARNSVFPLTVTVGARDREIRLELDIMDRSASLKKRLTTFVPQATAAALPPHLLLPPGFAAIPAAEAAAGLELVSAAPPSVPGATIDLSVRVSNPGPFYWRTGKEGGVRLGVVLVSDGREFVHEFPLAHDLYPGDSVVHKLHVTIPSRSRSNTVTINCFAGEAGSGRDWFPAAGALRLGE